jgi:hypothetical protein
MINKRPVQRCDSTESGSTLGLVGIEGDLGKRNSTKLIAVVAVPLRPEAAPAAEGDTIQIDVVDSVGVPVSSY